jgi:hypothetical protein
MMVLDNDASRFSVSCDYLSLSFPPFSIDFLEMVWVNPGAQDVFLSELIVVVRMWSCPIG